VEDLRVGVIGLGFRGGFGSLAHRPGHGARVAAVCDTDRDALANASRWYDDGAARYYDWRDVLAADVDAVVILTPDDTHEELAVASLEAGKATLVEKPLAITIEGCDRILAAAARTGSRLYVGHNMRHMAFTQLLREQIGRGAVGDVQTVWCRHFVGHGGDFYFKDWHADRRRSTGLLLQKGAHDLDIIHWLAGAPARRVTALGRLAVYGQIADRQAEPGQRSSTWFDYANWPPLAQTGLHPTVDVEDVSMVLLELTNGVLASYQQCHFTPDYWRNYTVVGTEGRLENFGDTGPGAVVRLWNQRADYNPDGDASFAVPQVTGGHGGADERIMDEFLRFARDGGPTLTSPVAARDAVAAASMATESLRNGGQPREVPPLDAAIAAYFDSH
jgi:predicted dehydrogenase